MRYPILALLSLYKPPLFSLHLSQHALLSAAHRFAQDLGFFNAISQSISLKMKKIDYSWLDKLRTLWASLVIGCDHTLQINHFLGDHEPALAQVFGLTRFPEQSQVNRLPHAFDTSHLEGVAQASSRLALLSFSLLRPPALAPLS
jgi:hypothetical protein